MDDKILPIQAASKDATRRRIQSIEVGFRLLRVLEAAEGFIPLKTLAAMTKMSPSKAYVYLASFVHEALVRQDPVTGHYGLGPFAAQLGFSALRQMDVIELSREELVKLREETGCAAHISVWGNRGPTLAVKVDGKYQGSMILRLGHVFSLRHSATGRVFLAYLPKTMTDAVIALEDAAGLADKTMLPRAERSMQDDLELVRRRGFATAEHAASHGFFGVAVPIFDFSKQMVASLTLFGPKHRFTQEMRTAFTRSLKEAAGRISLKLGGRTGNDESPTVARRRIAKESRQPA
jgi:DNA-binding IclR family transcriptional regulator